MFTQDDLKKVLKYNSKTGIFTWNVNGRKGVKIGNIAGFNIRGYKAVYIYGKNYYLHRLAFLYVYGEYPNCDIDHINRNKHDNKILNLRKVDESTNSQNQTKAHSNNKTGVLGVTISSNSGKYRAIIKVSGKNMHLGYFKNLDDAKNAYLKAKKIYHQGYVAEMRAAA